MENFKSGFVSIIGRTNVGKSTLLMLLQNKKLQLQQISHRQLEQQLKQY